MDRRVHGVLDGERGPEDLTSAETARLREYRETVGRALEALGDEAAPDVTASVMARIEALEEPRQARVSGSSWKEALADAWAWLWRPRQVRVRPAWGLVAGAAVVAAALLVPVGGGGPVALPGPTASGAGTAAAADRVLVQFRLDAPGAQSVRLAGDFTGWEPAHELREQAPGVWSVMIPLPPGVHDYAFVVDGAHWRPDPLAQPVNDGFGGTNSRLALMTPGSGGAL